jgi:GNAT superfamily N-acetyltransferase
LASVCDELRPWEFGLVARAHRYLGYYDFNVVIVDRPTGLGAAALEEVVDEALADVAHRRIDVEDASEAARLRPEFERLGWRAMAIAWMRHDGRAVPAGTAARVEAVPYDAVAALRREWHDEDFPGVDAGTFHAQAREVALAHHARVVAVLESGEPIAYAQLEGTAGAIEIGEVFVTARRRGQGLGTAVTAAAIDAAAAERPRDLWITADDEGRPKALYERLGFRSVWRTTEFLRLPAFG